MPFILAGLAGASAVFASFFGGRATAQPKGGVNLFQIGMLILLGLGGFALVRKIGEVL